MALDVGIAGDIWSRYQYIRDNGHLEYVEKASKCEDYFSGQQWDKSTLALLKSQRRPALTINKIISTMTNVMGEQIFNRSEIAFRPAKKGATTDVADALTRVFRHISDDNQLDWTRSDVYADGIITGRGFFDARLDFSDNMTGDVRVTQLNPKNVLIDPDADEYDPDKWSDVITTKWLSPDMIAMLYNEDDAEKLKGSDGSYWPYSYDAIDRDRDRFGNNRSIAYGPEYSGASAGLVRNIRVVERQWRKLDRILHFVNMTTGDLRPIPADMKRDEIAYKLEQNPGWTVTRKLAQRVRWTVVADKYVLHDDWSPYKCFTVVPFFPHFRRGRTVGLVENLLGPQELLNKVRSQELHIVNTTANSGWKLKKGSLQNMSVAELEQKGAQTGLVLELDEVEHADKISPNTVPTGLERISFKAEEDIKNISLVSNYDQGNAREDVSAKAIKYNQQAGSANSAKVLDNLRRTDYFLARNILGMVQEHYIEPRLFNITTDRLTGQTEPLEVNAPSPEGVIANDLTLGEYGITVTSEPQRDTFEDSQFDQALMLKTEAGVPIPDSVLIKNSRLRDKADIVKEIDAAANSPEAQEQNSLKKRGQYAEVGAKEAEGQLKQAQAKKAISDASDPANPDAEILLEKQKIEMEHQLEVEKMQMKFQLDKQKLEMELALKTQAQQQEMALKQKAAEDDAILKRAQAAAMIQSTRQQGEAKAAATQAGGAAGGKTKRKLSMEKSTDGKVTVSEL